MSTIIHLKASHGYKRSTGIKMPDGTIGVLRIGTQTWSPKATWRHWRGWLDEYPNEQAWRDAMDLRPKLVAPVNTVVESTAAPKRRAPDLAAWTNFVKYVKSTTATLTHAEALKIASPKWKNMSAEERSRFKDAAYRPLEESAAPPPTTKPRMVCPACDDTVPATGRAGGDGSHRACLAAGFRSGTWSTVKEWEAACEGYGESETASKYSKDFTMTPSLRSGTFPPGNYYIGDLCYGMADPVYDGIWGDVFGYSSGVFKSNDRPDQVFAMGSTGGDGLFNSSSGQKYPVDAGIIGIASMNLIGKSFGGCATIHTFTEPVHFHFDEQACTFTFDSGDFHLQIGNI